MGIIGTLLLLVLGAVGLYAALIGVGWVFVGILAGINRVLGIKG